MTAQVPFTVDPALTGVVMAYRNEAFIADQVLPVVRVPTQDYAYYKWDTVDGFNLNDTKVGRKSAPNEVEFSATRTTGSVEDYGLDDPIPMADLMNVPPGSGLDPRGRAVEGLIDIILAGREKRVADVVFGAANYPTANKETLSGTDQFSDYDASDPVGYIMEHLEVPMVRPNKLVFGSEAWRIFRMHPAVLSAVFSGKDISTTQTVSKGVASLQAVADLFEVDQILIGRARYNSAAKGQTASYARLWGKHVAMLYSDDLSNPTMNASRVSFGWIAQWGERVAGSIPDPNIGLHGGERVRVGLSDEAHVACSDVGYLITDAVA